MHTTLLLITAIKSSLIAVFVKKLVRVRVHHHLDILVVVFASTSS